YIEVLFNNLSLFINIYFRLYYSFFFQAEDGIRYRNVTGVQTCALPISAYFKNSKVVLNNTGLPGAFKRPASLIKLRSIRVCIERSEERRVGKECRNSN